MIQNINKSINKQKQTFYTVNEVSELMKFLIAKLPDTSRNSIKSLLTHQQIFVNNQIVTKYNYMLEAGDQVSINKNKPEIANKYHGLRILFEDQHIIVIEKDAGLLSIATDRERQQTAYFILNQHVRNVNPKNHVYIVHRLDKDASGVMMFAKSIEVQKKMQSEWEKSVIDRRYSVVVEGKVEQNEGTITSWLKESIALIMYSYNFDNGGQKAITHYKVLKNNENFTLLEVKLDTGRKNQIRVHMKDIGHSIVGDKKYGATSSPLKRLGLHANILSFSHPVSNEMLCFESPVPFRFIELLSRR